MGTLVKMPYFGVTKPTLAEARLIGLKDDYQREGALLVYGSSTELGDSDPNICAGTNVSNFSQSYYCCLYSGYYLFDYSGNSYSIKYWDEYGIYLFSNSERPYNLDPSYYTEKFDSLSDIVSAYLGYVKYPITYRLTNCSAPSAPTEAAVGDSVSVGFTFADGYGIVNPSTDIYVTNNGVVVPSSYSNGTLTFTMPDPS